MERQIARERRRSPERPVDEKGGAPEIGDDRSDHVSMGRGGTPRNGSVRVKDLVFGRR
jgi:hypothetical protein